MIYIRTPFTSAYPRYTIRDAIEAIKALGDNFIVVDTETTNIGKKAEVLDIAIVDFRTEKVLFNSLIHPKSLGEDYEVSKARAINGISQESLINAPTLPDVWDEVLGILKSSHITAFNADFDLRVIRNSAYKWMIDVPPLYASCWMKISQAFLLLDFWPSLDEVAEHFAVVVDESNRHQALGDCVLTIECIKRMRSIAQVAK